MYVTFYKKEMAVEMLGHTSQSTLKPKLFADKASGFVRGYDPVDINAFYLAHTKEYVDGFFSGTEPMASSSGFEWSAAYAESQRYTVGSLKAAITNVLDGMEFVRDLNKGLDTPYIKGTAFSVAPVSGFHHATPKAGKMFCAFSGQAIASMLVYEERGACAAYLDLDSHYGNSISDSIKFNPRIKEAIKFNVNPVRTGQNYIDSLARSLSKIETAWTNGDIHYVVYCHGADSIVGDELGHNQVTEKEWFQCTELVTTMCAKNGIPLVLCLFGGYGDMDKIVELHLQDAALINKINDGFNYQPG